MKRTVRVVEVDRRVFADNADVEPSFLAAFTNRGVGRRFERLDLAAGKFPKASQWHALGPEAGEETITVAHDRHGDDLGTGAGHASLA